MTNPQYLVAFDPGDVTGVALFKVVNNEAEPVDMGQYNLEQLEEFCLDFSEDVKVVVYETYKVLPHKARAHSGSKVGAAQAIGMIKVLARRLNAELVEQRPDQMHLGLKWAGVKMPKTHSQSHQYSAFGHGFFYLRTHRLIKSALEKQNG